jgi:hypothetical protein
MLNLVRRSDYARVEVDFCVSGNCPKGGNEPVEIGPRPVSRCMLSYEVAIGG